MVKLIQNRYYEIEWNVENVPIASCSATGHIYNEMTASGLKNDLKIIVLKIINFDKNTCASANMIKAFCQDLLNLQKQGLTIIFKEE